MYLAQDTKLDRKVALKILPADVASKRDRMERFIREAKAAAALSHPNIAQIFEVGEHDGMHFIAMEFVDGVTLRDLIHQEHKDLPKLLRILQHVAEGLSKAHAVGIVHRDLKPDNIMVSRDGYAKILDFGLAKLVEPTQRLENKNELSQAVTAALPPHSTPGVILGTVGYMSPEQAQGKPEEVDQRSDVFSFGCILFEAATRKRPFQGDSIIKSLHSLIYEPAPPVKDFNPTAPADLQRIIRRCLAKDKDERYQTIKDVATELKELRRDLETSKDATKDFDTTVPPVSTTAPISTATGNQSTSTGSITHTASSAEYLVSEIKKHKRGVVATIAVLVLLTAGVAYWLVKNRSSVATDSITSIAVLPFQNRSADADTDYLSDGLAESLIFRLSQLPGLKVSPASSVMRYKGRDTDVSKIASELEVDAVMTGRFIKRGDNLNITVELVDVRNNKSLWGEQYERKMSDLLMTQREIAANITEKLQLKLTGNENKGVVKRYTNNNEAYQLYLKGRFYFAKRTDADIRRSVELYQQAIKLDPSFALAYVAIGEAYAVMPSYPYMSPKESMPHAKAATAKALELDPELPEAHTVAGVIASVYDWDWKTAEREFKRALELDPNIALTHYRYAWVYLSPVGRHDQAIAEMKRAMELEPLALTQGANFAAVYMFARQFDKALDQAKKTYDLDPSNVTPRNWMSRIYNINGMYAESLAISEKTLQPDYPFYFDRAYSYAKLGRRQDAEAVLKEWKREEKTKYIINYWVAEIYAALGEKDLAFAELEKAYQSRDWFFPRIKTDPNMDALRDDPRFADLVKRLNFPE